MIFIIDKNERIVGTLSNTGAMDKSIPFFNDRHNLNLENGSESYEFSTMGDSMESEHLVVGNQIAFNYKGETKLFSIIEVEESHNNQFIKTVYAESCGLELLNTYVRPTKFTGVNLNDFATAILSDTPFTVGRIGLEFTAVKDVTITSHENVYKLLQDIAVLEFDAEISFRVEIANNRIIGRYVDFYGKRGRDTKHRFEYGVNMTEVKKNVDASNICTALIGVGNGDLDFKSVDAPDKPLNQDFLVNQEAYDRFNVKGRHIFGVYKYETDSPHELLKFTREEIVKRAEPKISYELNVELLDYDVELGDTVYIVDNDFNPPLYLEARVNELELSMSDPKSNKCKLANFKEIKSKITNDMTEIFNQLDGYVETKFPIGGDKIKHDAISSNHIPSDQIYNRHIVDIVADKITSGTIDANKINVVNLNADNITTGTLDAQVIDVVNLNADNIVTGSIDASQIDVTNLNADNIVTGHLHGDRVTANTIGANHIMANTITAGSQIVANGAIGNAQISEIEADKIFTGTLDTARVKVSGADGHLQISGNRMQVFEGLGNQAFERVSVGDVEGDGSVYGLRVRGKDGQTVLFDHNGVYHEGITDGSINNQKVMANANIHGSKLDIDSVVVSINDNSTEVIEGIKIGIDGTDLTTKITQITNRQDADGKRIENNTTRIDANEKNINLKVDTQIYEQDKINMTNSINKNTADINILNNQIALKVEQTDIDTAIANVKIGAKNLLRNTKKFDKLWTGSHGTVKVEDNVKGDFNALTLKRTNFVQGQSRAFINQYFNESVDLFEKGKWVSISGYLYVDSSVPLPNNVGNSIFIRYFDKNGNYHDIADVGFRGFVNDKWVYFEATGQITEEIDPNRDLGFMVAMAQNGFIKLMKPMVVIGNKIDQEWSPHPDDIEANIDTKIDQAKAEIKIETDKITQSVENVKTEVSGVRYDLDNLKIGTRNFIRNSANPIDTKFWHHNSNLSVIPVEDKFKPPFEADTLFMIKNATTTENVAYTQRYKLEGNTEYTASAYVYIEDDIKDVEIYLLCRKQETGTPTYYDYVYIPVKTSDYNWSTLKNKWVRIHGTVKTDSDVIDGYFRIDHNGVSANTGSNRLLFTRVQLEKSNKVSDWRLADEDLVSTMDIKINDAKAEIKIETDGIKQTVSNQNTVIQGVKDKVENLNIGARNYVRNSAFVYGNKSWIFAPNCTIDNTKTLNGHPSCKSSQTGLTADSWRGCVNYDLPINKKFSIKQGDDITISCWYYVENKALLDDAIGLELKGKQTGTTNEVGIMNELVYPQNIVENKWTRITVSSVARADFDECCLRAWVRKNGTAWFTDFKLERGNKPSDWTSAPEDSDDNINTIIKDYATKSEVNQTVNNLEIKFSESGGYNLLRNSTGFGNDLHWSTTGNTVLDGFTDNLIREQTSSGKALRLQSTVATETYSRSYRFNLQRGKTYTISGKYYVGSESKGIDVFLLASNTLTAETGLTDFNYDDAYHIINDNAYSNLQYRTFKRTITLRDTNLSGYIRIDHNGVNLPNSTYPYSYVYFADIMVEEGEYGGMWTPHPSEIYDGIVTIDKNGITVASTNSNTHTVMDSDSFRVESNQGGTLAEFGINSSIPTLNSNVIYANEVYATNIPTKNNANGSSDTWWVNGATGNDGNNGLTANTPFKTVQKAIDQIADLQNRDVTIKVSGSVSGFDIKGKSGIGLINMDLEDNVVVNGRVVLGGCTSRLYIRSLNGTMKPTFKQGIAIYRCMNVDLYGLCFRGECTEGGNIYIRDTNYCAVNTCDLGGLSTRLGCAIKVQASLLWFYGCRGSNITDCVGQFAFSHVMMARGGTSNVPDYTNGILVNYDGSGRIQNWMGGTFTKTPSIGHNPSYTPTQKTSTWSFNKIFSKETLNGWSDRNELIQGYYSGWNTGRWTGYMQMQDSFASIRSAISSATNLSGRIYVQRASSSGNATGSKLCLYASDGTLITNTTTINRGQGVWVTIPSAVLSKIQSGAVTGFYLQANASNSATYFKCMSNPKIEITYTN